MPIRFVIITILLFLFFASQIYWLRAFWRFTGSRIASPSSRRVVRTVTLIGFAFLFAYNLFPGSLSPGGHTSPTRMTLGVALLEVPFKLWFFGSLLGFIISIPFWAVDRLLRVAGLIHRRG